MMAKSKGLDETTKVGYATIWGILSRFDSFGWGGGIHDSRCKYIQEKVSNIR